MAHFSALILFFFPQRLTTPSLRHNNIIIFFFPFFFFTRRQARSKALSHAAFVHLLKLNGRVKSAFHRKRREKKQLQRSFFFFDCFLMAHNDSLLPCFYYLFSSLRGFFFFYTKISLLPSLNFARLCERLPQRFSVQGFVTFSSFFFFCSSFDIYAKAVLIFK